MRAISAAFREKLDENTTMLAKATLTFANGAVRELTGDDLVSASCEQSTSSSGSFDIGAAIVGKCDVTLNNHDSRFDDYDFTNAQLVLYCGCQTSADTTEWVRLGTYIVDQPDAYAGTIALSGLDKMSMLQVPYSGVKTAYPATLQVIVRDLCSVAGVTLGTPDFPNDSYAVPRRPDDSSYTCLDALSNAAQIAGLYAKCDERGRVTLGWYDEDAASRDEAWLDGRTFDAATPYASGDKADGGAFADYGSGAAADGGTFEANRRRQMLYAFSDLTVFTDDVVVTGVRVTAQNQVVKGSDGKETNGKDGETALFGKTGYVLDMTGNKMVTYGTAAAVAKQVGSAVVGMRFRPFSGKHVSDPTVEAGDSVLLTDFKQNVYKTYCTSCKLAINSNMDVECSAKSASRNSASVSSAATQAIVAARNELKREQDSRERAMAELNQQLKDSPGLYSTKVKQGDGSYIYYMHDKRELENSKIVWKMTAEAVGVSTDGGKTYATALNASGDAVLRRVYAIGINADYIQTGRLESKNGKQWIDLDTGKAQLALEAATTVGGSTVGAIAQGKVDAQTQLSIFNKLTNNGATKGLYLTDGSLYINASYIRTGALSANLVSGGTLQGVNIISKGTGTTSVPEIRISAGQVKTYWDGVYRGLLTMSGNGLELCYVYGGVANGLRIGSGGFSIADSAGSSMRSGTTGISWLNGKNVFRAGQGGVSMDAMDGSGFDLGIGGTSIKSSDGSTIKLGPGGISLTAVGGSISISDKGLTIKTTYGDNTTLATGEYSKQLYVNGKRIVTTETAYAAVSEGVKNNFFNEGTVITGKTSEFILPVQMNSDGRVARWIKGCYLNFKNGVLIGATLPS